MEYLLISPSFAGSLDNLEPRTRTELAQETVERFKGTRRITPYGGEALLRATLLQIAHNVAREYRLRVAGGSESRDPSPPCNPSPVATERRSPTYKKGLSAIHVQILELYEVAKLSYAQIASRLGLKLGTVKSRLNRARLMRKQLESRT